MEGSQPQAVRAPGELVGLDRLNAFSDGVYAIAITLLALELTVPEGAESLPAALAGQWPEFLGYVISFAFIGGHWLTHARVTRLMRQADGASAGINLLALLFVAILPFSTSLMVKNLADPEVGVAVLVYGVNLLLASTALSLLLVYVGRERTLRVDGLAEGALTSLVRARWIAIGVTVAALAAALVAPLVAVGLYVVITAGLFIAPLLEVRRRSGRA